MNKKTLSGLLIFMLTIISSIFGLTNVNAETYDGRIKSAGKMEENYYYAHIRDYGEFTKHWDEMSWLVRTSDNAFVYCVQPFVKVNSNATYEVTTEDLAMLANITQENWNKIAKIAYYGYGYVGEGVDHSASKWYAATQMLIWEYADPTVESYFTKTIGGPKDASILAEEMAEIMDIVNNHNVRPNLEGVPSEMVIGDSVTLTDSNNVLNKYTIENVRGGNVSKNGNEITITANEVGNINFTLNKNGNMYGEPVQLYYATSAQNVVRRGNIDPIQLPFRINVLGGTITPNKVDSDTLTNEPQGEASLAGAVYGIYKEDGTKVGTVTTGADGRGTSDYLPNLGRFYLLEEKPSEGYLLDETKYYFEITEDNLNPEIQVVEKVITLDFDFTKVYADKHTGIMKAEPNVKFGIYNYKNELVKELTTDSQGNFKFTLPYGTYTVKQLTSTENFEMVEDFIIEVKETGPVVKKTIANAEITAKLKVVKIDSETKEVIRRSGIKFKIFNLDTNEYVCQNVTYPTTQKICVFETNELGEFITPYELSSGRYRLEEVDQIIDGYLWNDKSHPFEIGENMEVITDSEYGIIFETLFSNTRVEGEVNIHKNGEKVVISDGKITYVKTDLEGVTFGIYAREDILHNGKVIYHKGDLVTTIVSDVNGDAKYSGMYLGKYFAKELESLPNYKLDTTEYDFELKYEDQYTPIVRAMLEIDNFLIKGDLEFTKTSISDGKPLPNTLISIFNENDEEIFSGRTSSDGKIIIKNIPAGRFYILEREAPEGFLINEEPMWFEIKEDGEVVKANMEDERIKAIVIIYKVDQNGNALAGVKIGLYDLEGNLVYEGITNEEGVIETTVEYGEYYWKEIETINGFALSEEKIYVSVKEDGAIAENTLVNIEIPNTLSNTYINIIGSLVVLVGAGIIIISNKNNKKKN